MSSVASKRVARRSDEFEQQADGPELLLRLPRDPREDPKFQAELDYEGYRTIEEYDNDAYNLDLDRGDDAEEELELEDRKGDEALSEESPIDVQENRESLPER